VRDARHHLVVVELVAQLAEVASHRDHLLHSCNSSNSRFISTRGTPYTGSQSPRSPAPLLQQQTLVAQLAQVDSPEPGLLFVLVTVLDTKTITRGTYS